MWLRRRRILVRYPPEVLRIRLHADLLPDMVPPACAPSSPAVPSRGCPCGRGRFLGQVGLLIYQGNPTGAIQGGEHVLSREPEAPKTHLPTPVRKASAVTRHLPNFFGFYIISLHGGGLEVNGDVSGAADNNLMADKQKPR